MPRWDTRIIVALLLIHMLGFSMFYYSSRSEPPRPAKNAYITFTNTDAYAKGVVGLAASLKDVDSQYPLIVLVTEGVSPRMRHTLRSLGCIVRDTQPIPLPSALSLEFQRWGPAFTKLRAWELTEYDRLVWLDSDLLVVRDVDSMFELPHRMLACIDTDASSCEYKESRMGLMNSGIMVLTPDRAVFAHIMASLNNKTLLARGTINDQDVLMHAMPDWHKLPYPQYSAQITHCECTGDKRMWDSKAVKILHFTAGAKTLPKPWDYDPQKEHEFEICVQKIYAMWWEKYTKALATVPTYVE